MNLQLKIYQPDKISSQDLVDIETFRFSDKQHDDLIIDREYNPLSTYCVYYLDDVIVSTIKVMTKNSGTDILPIEYAIKPNKSYFDVLNKFPVCEMGGLKISENLSFKQKYVILNKTIRECTRQLILLKNKMIYVSCKESLESMYTLKFGFNFETNVFYGDDKYSALSRPANWVNTPWESKN